MRDLRYGHFQFIKKVDAFLAFRVIALTEIQNSCLHWLRLLLLHCSLFLKVYRALNLN